MVRALQQLEIASAVARRSGGARARARAASKQHPSIAPTASRSSSSRSSIWALPLMLPARLRRPPLAAAALPPPLLERRLPCEPILPCAPRLAPSGMMFGVVASDRWWGEALQKGLGRS